MKLFDLISKIVAISLIFGGTIGIVIKRYSTETTTRTITTTSSIGPMATIFILAIVGVAIWFGINQFSEMIKQSKFGWLAIITFGLLLGAILFGIWFIFNSITIAAQSSVEDYIEMMSYHRQTVYYMLYPIGIGVCIGIISKLMQWKIIKL